MVLPRASMDQLESLRGEVQDAGAAEPQRVPPLEFRCPDASHLEVLVFGFAAVRRWRWGDQRSPWVGDTPVAAPAVAVPDHALRGVRSNQRESGAPLEATCSWLESSTVRLSDMRENV